MGSECVKVSTADGFYLFLLASNVKMFILSYATTLLLRVFVSFLSAFEETGDLHVTDDSSHPSQTHRKMNFSPVVKLGRRDNEKNNVESFMSEGGAQLAAHGHFSRAEASQLNRQKNTNQRLK